MSTGRMLGIPPVRGLRHSPVSAYIFQPRGNLDQPSEKYTPYTRTRRAQTAPAARSAAGTAGTPSSGSGDRPSASAEAGCAPRGGVLLLVAAAGATEGVCTVFAPVLTSTTEDWRVLAFVITSCVAATASLQSPLTSSVRPERQGRMPCCSTLQNLLISALHTNGTDLPTSCLQPCDTSSRCSPRQCTCERAELQCLTRSAWHDAGALFALFAPLWMSGSMSSWKLPVRCWSMSMISGSGAANGPSDMPGSPIGPGLPGSSMITRGPGNRSWNRSTPMPAFCAPGGGPIWKGSPGGGPVRRPGGGPIWKPGGRPLWGPGGGPIPGPGGGPISSICGTMSLAICSISPGGMPPGGPPTSSNSICRGPSCMTSCLLGWPRSAGGGPCGGPCCGGCCAAQRAASTAPQRSSGGASSPMPPSDGGSWSSRRAVRRGRAYGGLGR
mmetsp:Transcript_39877/g.114192  ORF Transcript_39877/g.114192 Transcript_39877/m.114192 type:complete len:440 (-) Transcript_39877:54-1373(-)